MQTNTNLKEQHLSSNEDPRIQLVTKQKPASELNKKTVKYKVDSSTKNGHHSNKGDLNLKRRRILEESKLIRYNKRKTTTKRGFEPKN